MSKTICLNMVLTKNVSGLAYSLRSAKDHIDHWLIADLGIDDETDALIEEILGGLPGEIVSTDSANIVESRNALIEYSRDKADYLLLLDANTCLMFETETETETPDWKATLREPCYLIPRQGEIRCLELRLINTQQQWQYLGICCEYLTSEQEITDSVVLPEASIQVLHIPELELDQQEHDKSALEYAIASKEVGSVTDGHLLFNLAKITLLQGDYQKALETFDAYLNTEQKWDEEWQWYALYHRAKLLERLEESDDTVIDAYEQAYQFRPVRAEPLFELARLHRERGKHAKAHLYAQQAFSMPIPKSESYDLELRVYEWHIPNEYAMACQQLGYLEQAVIASNKALHERKLKKNIFRSLLASRQRSLEALRANKQPKKTDAHCLNKIKIVVPYRNAGKLLADCVKSILNQDYSNFTATFIDDCSTDDSNRYIPCGDKRIELVKNTQRVGPLVNRMDFINRCKPDDIVLYLDGDDQLASDDVLSYINQIYNDYDCWLSYGQFLSQNGTFGYAEPYPDKQSLLTALENGTMRFPMHPITHRAALFHRITDFDPNYSCFKDNDGEWLFYASDAVLARPLFYMAGFANIHYCNRVLYLYTEGHEISESIHNKRDQIETCRLTALRLRPPALESLSF